MITKKEKDLVEKIFDEGCRKYAEKVVALAGVLGCDRSLALDQCSGFGRWLVENAEKWDEVFKKHGLRVSASMDSGTTFIMNVEDCKDGSGAISFHVNWYRSGNKLLATHFSDPPHERTRVEHTAEEAINSVAAALKSLNMWTILAAKYMAIKADVDDIETKMSDARVEKAMHQLELLKKL